MTEETTTEQLAEIDRDMADIERQVAELVEEAQQADYPQPQPQPEPCAPCDSRDTCDTTTSEQLAEIEPQPQPEPQPQAAAIEELRSEVSYVQRLLGESNRKVTQLEELVTSLRTISVASEKAFEAAGQDNTALRNQLEAAKAELVQERLERNRWHNQVLRVTAELDDKTTQCEILQIELDAAQQVPADSPELRQLQADLEQATLGRDTYRDGYNRVLSDLETARETAKAEAVETITEWLQAFRGCNSPSLALLLLEALPSIMRSLTGLADDEIE